MLFLLDTVCPFTMSGPRISVHARWIVGKVIGTKMNKTAKVRVTRMVLDNYLLKVYMLLSSFTPLLITLGCLCTDIKHIYLKVQMIQTPQ